MGFELYAHLSDNPVVNELIEKMRVVQEEAKSTLAKAKDNMAYYYNCGQTLALEYKPGDHVYLDASKIATTQPL